MISYVCKYTPVELLRGFGAECAVLDAAPDNFELAEREAHANLCGFGKTVLQAALRGETPELVLVNCCDVMRRVYDILLEKGCCRFLFLLDLPHTDSECQTERFARELARLRDAYAAHSGAAFDEAKFFGAFESPAVDPSPYVAILGARAGRGLEDMLRASLSLPVKNLTCVGNRAVSSSGLGGLSGRRLSALTRTLFSPSSPAAVWRTIPPGTRCSRTRGFWASCTTR